MKYRLYMLAAVLASCSQDQVISPPPDVIPQEKLIPLIVDLQMLQSHYERNFPDPASYRDVLDSSSRIVFEEHGVTQAQFDESYSYYAYDMQAIYSIYESALDTINFRINQPD